jgi:hypothetical protein
MRSPKEPSLALTCCGYSDGRNESGSYWRMNDSSLQSKASVLANPDGAAIFATSDRQDSSATSYQASLGWKTGQPDVVICSPSESNIPA